MKRKSLVVVVSGACRATREVNMPYDQPAEELAVKGDSPDVQLEDWQWVAVEKTKEGNFDRLCVRCWEPYNNTISCPRCDMRTHEENVEELIAQLQDVGGRAQRKLMIVLSDTADEGDELKLTDVHFESDSNTIVAEVSPG